VALVAGAQQPAMPVVGFLSNAVPGPKTDILLAAFNRGLAENGYVEGRTVAIEYRWTNGRNDEFPALAAKLVRRGVAVIATSGGDTSALAAKAATSTIPIVFTTANDPVRTGLVKSLNRPGGNATGVSRLGAELIPKRLQMLAEVVPEASTMAFLVNSADVNAEPYAAEAEMAAQSLGRNLRGHE
jgi:putative ABC transport system substrate-binding protein